MPEATKSEGFGGSHKTFMVVPQVRKSYYLKIQGGFLKWSAPKVTKCKTLRT